MKIFIDTNVFVSAVATMGLCADVIREVLVSHRLIISAPLLAEIEKTLKNKFEVPYELTRELIELIERDALFSTPADLPEIKIQDEDDIIILSSALNGNADLFITGDKELLELRKVKNMEIVSPRMFWEKLKSSVI